MKWGGEPERYCVQAQKSLKLEREKEQDTGGQHRIITNSSSLIKGPKEIT